MNTTNEFTTYNDWNVFRRGKLSIVACDDGRISHLTTPRGKVLVRSDAERWLIDHHRDELEFDAWLDRREKAVSDWKHNTPHKRYDCDGGCLAVIADGVRMDIRNFYGDGNLPVYVVYKKDVMNADRDPAPYPPGFTSNGVAVRCKTLQVLDYDCDGGNVFVTIEGADEVEFLHDNTGAMIVAVYRKNA